MMLTELGSWILVTLTGLAVGSFANVCIHRLPRGQSVVMPPSHCPFCESQLRWFENIPVVSFLWLRGKCRVCRTAISLRYPLIEMAAAGLWCLAWWVSGSLWQFAELALLFMALLVVSVIDRDHGIIPNPISLGGMIVGILLAIWAPDRSVLSAVLGCAAPALLLAVIRWVGSRAMRRESIGLGDVKLAGMIGAFLGWQPTLLALYAGYCFAAVWILPVLLIKGRQSVGAVRMAPFFTAGALTAVVFGAEIWQWIW